MSDAQVLEKRPPLMRIDALGPQGRLAAYREGEMGREELSAWAASYPEEVPLLNGELPWIAATLE